MKWLKPAEVSGLLLKFKQIRTICFAFLLSLFSANLFATGITGAASSASCDNPTLNTYSGTSNLQANWQANKIDLMWYSDGSQITNVQSAATTCNYDSGLTVPSNPPTKTGYTFNGWKVRGLPDGYTRLQYIQSTGTQYFDTGIVGKNGVSVEAKFELTTTDNGSLFGNRMTGSTRFWPAMWFTNKWNPAIANDSYTSHSVTIAAGTIYVTSFKSNASGWTFDVNGTRIVSGSQTVSNTNNMWMFGTNNGQVSPSTLQYPFKGKVYYAKIWNNDVLVRSFVPAKNSGNVVGMYDMVTGTFYTNIGSGTFTAGPAAN